MDEILATDNGTDVLWGLGDHEGTIRDIVSGSTRAVVEHRTYDSFGKLTSTWAQDFLFGLAGMPYDVDTNLYQTDTTPYDPLTARRLSEDRLSFASGTTNFTIWAGNNPWNYTDPSGMCSQSVSTLDRMAAGDIAGSFGQSNLASQVFRAIASQSYASNISASTNNYFGGYTTVSEAYGNVSLLNMMNVEEVYRFAQPKIASVERDANGRTVAMNWDNGAKFGTFVNPNLQNEISYRVKPNGDVEYFDAFTGQRLILNETHGCYVGKGDVIPVEPPSSVMLAQGLTGFAGGPIINALANWSRPVAATLTVGSTTTGAINTGLYSKATYDYGKIGDTQGVIENGTNATLSLQATLFSAYNIPKSLKRPIAPPSLIENTSSTTPARSSTQGYWWSGRYSTPASQPGAYQASGGKVFPTRRNSGLSSAKLRAEQEAFTLRRLQQDNPVEVVRGQAREAGLTSLEWNERLADRGAEAAVQRATVRNQSEGVK